MGQLPLLAQISAASVQGMVATGDRAGRRVRRRLTDPEDGVRSGALCYASRGFSLRHIRLTLIPLILLVRSLPSATNTTSLES